MSVSVLHSFGRDRESTQADGIERSHKVFVRESLLLLSSKATPAISENTRDPSSAQASKDTGARSASGTFLPSLHLYTTNLKTFRGMHSKITINPSVSMSNLPMTIRYSGLELLCIT